MCCTIIFKLSSNLYGKDLLKDKIFFQRETSCYSFFVFFFTVEEAVSCLFDITIYINTLRHGSENNIQVLFDEMTTLQKLTDYKENKNRWCLCSCNRTDT